MLLIPIINHDTPSNSEDIACFIRCFTKQRDLLVAIQVVLGEGNCVWWEGRLMTVVERTLQFFTSQARKLEHELEEAVEIIFFGWKVGASRCSCR